MKVRDFVFSPAALDRNGIADAQTLAGAGNFTLATTFAVNGVVTLDYPRHVAVYCGGDVSGVTFTITGTDRLGDALVETITGVNATTVAGSYNFKTITSVAADGAVGTNTEIGTYSSFDTGWFPVDYKADRTDTRIYLSDSPSLVWTLKYTMANPFASGFNEYTCDSITHSSSAASGQAHFSHGIRALRLSVSSFSAGDITWSIWQRR